MEFEKNNFLNQLNFLNQRFKPTKRTKLNRNATKALRHEASQNMKQLNLKQINIKLLNLKTQTITSSLLIF